MSPLVLLSAWVVFWNPDSLESFRKHAIDEALAEWIACTPEGRAVRRNDFDKERAEFLKFAKGKRTRIYAMASNFGTSGFEAQRVQSFLGDPAKRARHVQDLVGIVVEDGFHGLDLDYESLEAGDRDGFSLFVEELGKSLRSKGKKLSIAVHAKTSEPGNWGGTIAQDWRRLGAAVDVFRVMTYDQHWATSDVGPIAGNAWAEQVMRFALSQMPAKKVELGLAGYGYDWSIKPARSLVWKDWSGKATAVDAESGEYVDGQARFSGLPAYRSKVALARKLGVRGVALWYLGSEEPGLLELFPQTRAER